MCALHPSTSHLHAGPQEARPNARDQDSGSINTAHLVAQQLEEECVAAHAHPPPHLQAANPKQHRFPVVPTLSRSSSRKNALLPMRSAYLRVSWPRKGVRPFHRDGTPSCAAMVRMQCTMPAVGGRRSGGGLEGRRTGAGWRGVCGPFACTCRWAEAAAHLAPDSSPWYCPEQSSCRPPPPARVQPPA